MIMPIKEAVRIASKWVYVEPLAGRDYRVNYWNKAHRAWWDGTITNRNNALRTAWECKLYIALDMLRVRDADEIAHDLLDANYPKDWRHSVREGLRIAQERARVVQ